MQINPKLIKNQFEKSLDTYNKNAVVQQIMAEKLVEETAKIKNCYDNVLELGSGSGLLTKELIKKLTFNTYSANDLVSKSKYYGNLFKNLLNKDGILAFSTFSPENFKEIRELTGLSLDYKSSGEIKNIFEKNYEIIHIEEFTHTLNFSNPLELLAHMKNTGVNSLTTQHWTFKEVKEFCDNYKSKFPEITLTYSPVIVICQKM